jgi:hypothetical protein
MLKGTTVLFVGLVVWEMRRDILPLISEPEDGHRHREKSANRICRIPITHEAGVSEWIMITGTKLTYASVIPSRALYTAVESDQKNILTVFRQQHVSIP